MNQGIRSEQRILKGIEIDVFSYRIPESRFKQVLDEVCGEHCNIDDLPTKARKPSASFFITPKDFCLVDGGMMYTSAMSILSQLTSKGLLIQEFRTIEA